MEYKKIQRGATITVIIISFFIGWLTATQLIPDESKTDLSNQVKDQGKVQNQKREQPDLGGSLDFRNTISVWKIIQKNYVDTKKLDRQKLIYGATKGFVEALDDPYSVFMTPEESKEFQTGLEGELEGIGAELEVRDGRLMIVTPLKNSPAERAGLKISDIIYKINDALSENLTFYDAVRRIRGKAGTKVTLTIIREGTTQPFEVTITRQKIEIESVTLESVAPGISLLTISQFNDHTKVEFGKTIQKILLERPKALILDLRFNGGGYLDISIDITSEFFKEKKPVVLIKERDPTKNEILQTKGNGRLADFPMVLLVNKGSASASEIVAGALQDHGRGIIIGEKTFGKGSVQSIEDLPDGSSLRYTVAKWYTPKDRSIDGVGITPDKEITLTEEDAKAKKDPQLDVAVEYLKNVVK